MIESGTLLQNRYRVVKQIGQGGMGAVYVATDERFSSTVAVKQTFFDDPALRRAFEREAHLLNHLRHTALPKVSDHFAEGEGQFLVMEFIEGSDLSELLKARSGSAFPVADVLAWADALLDALDYLHTHEPQVIHRDIKPQNLKLTPRGQIVLLDFGLAKGNSTETRANLTASVFGYSRNYAPLEQIQGTGTDARSDLYSLAATLYHLLTGAAPVDALTRAGAIINSQPDPLRPAHLAHAQVPAAVGEILRRAMSQNAAHRQASAAEMRAALRRAATAIPIAAFDRHQSATDAPTVLEATQTAFAQQSLSETHSTTLLQHSPQTSASETTFVDAFGVRRRQSTMTAIEPPPLTPPAPEKPKAKLVGVAVAVLVACALVAFPLIRRASERDANPQVQTETSPASSTAAPQTDAPGTTQAESEQETLATTPDSEATPAPSPSPGVESQAANGQPATDAGAATPNSGSNPDASKSVQLPASSDNSGLSIQSPASSAQPVRNNAAAEYDAQRAEELRRRKEQQEKQLREQREREQQPQYMAVPHYELERGGQPPPQPGGGGHRPPPPPGRPPS
ncbi:MAG TPA: protein kinase [Pyrinomonadaceae bacterium]|jgi:serine/threonine protein kinase|nr:protein kinase [Pyrinomonadaceae bacterium]